MTAGQHGLELGRRHGGDVFEPGHAAEEGRRDGRAATIRAWQAHLCAPDARAVFRERGRQAWDTGEDGLLGRHLLIDEAFGFIFHLLLFFLAHHAAAASAVPGALGFGGGFADVVAVVEAVAFAGAGARPEAGYSVVGAGGEDVAEWVPVEGPDGEVVGVLEAVGGMDGLCGGVAWVGGVVGGYGGHCAGRAVRFV